MAAAFPAGPRLAPPTAYESVAAIIRARAEADPAAIAITGDGRQVTFGELDERSSRLAHALAGLGVGRGDRVAYLDQNATEFWETMFAAAKLGAIMTPLNFRLAGRELRAILQDAEPAVLIAAGPILGQLGRDAVPADTTVVGVGPGAAAAADYESLLASGAPADPGEQATGADLAVLMYSSGTTGASKGVCITAENLLTGVATIDLFQADFTQSYGLAETVGVATLLRPDDHRSGETARLRSAGRPAACVELAVVDPVTGVALAAGQIGEVVVRGRNVTPGYWRRPEATAALFLPGGWLRTGDAGYLDADGYLTIADRIKDIIISGGENVIPGEVEQVLAEHDGVLEAAVVGVPSPRCPGTRRARCLGASCARLTGSTVTARSANPPGSGKDRHDREPVGRAASGRPGHPGPPGRRPGRHGTAGARFGLR
jgi:acyl-CoA synthetase (AMP-forming)/AMP-acid ligase II